jgi:hypothetical protein
MSYIIAAELNVTNVTGTSICQLENVDHITTGVFLHYVVMNRHVDKRMVTVITVAKKDGMVSCVEFAAVLRVKMSVTGKLVNNLLLCNKK